MHPEGDTGIIDFLEYCFYLDCLTERALSIQHEKRVSNMLIFNWERASTAGGDVEEEPMSGALIRPILLTLQRRVVQELLETRRGTQILHLFKFIK